MKSSSRITKVIIALFLLLTAVSIAATYYNTMVLRDFVIINDLEEAF
jgi:hypothetical protein